MEEECTCSKAIPMSKFDWSFPEHDLTIAPSEAHVWRAWLDQDDFKQSNHETLLSPAEKVVANKFFFERDRNHYITSRVILRSLLGRYLSIDPGKIAIVRGQHGKPLLDNNPLQIEFNLSHSQGLGLFVFTTGNRIGIDIECVLPLSDFNQLAKSFLTPNEMEALSRLPEEIQLQGFYTAWTRKEALAKALGVGIGNILHKFEVTISPIEEPAINEIDQEITDGSHWKLLDLEPNPSYVAALAVETSEIFLRLYDFP
jgi:4'-phosphopantetheinyl transferase